MDGENESQDGDEGDGRFPVLITKGLPEKYFEQSKTLTFGAGSSSYKSSINSDRSYLKFSKVKNPESSPIVVQENLQTSKSDIVPECNRQLTEVTE